MSDAPGVEVVEGAQEGLRNVVSDVGLGDAMPGELLRQVEQVAPLAQLLHQVEVPVVLEEGFAPDDARVFQRQEEVALAAKILNQPRERLGPRLLQALHAELLPPPDVEALVDSARLALRQELPATEIREAHAGIVLRLNLSAPRQAQRCEESGAGAHVAGGPREPTNPASAPHPFLTRRGVPAHAVGGNCNGGRAG